MGSGHSHEQTFTLAVHETEPDEGDDWAEVLDLPGCVGAGRNAG